MMKKQRAPLPDFHSSFTHSCNNLASYEVKKNPDPSKKITTTIDNMNKSGSNVLQFARSKMEYEEKKEYGTSIDELKTFSRPNLDDGNRFYEDNKRLREEFGP